MTSKRRDEAKPPSRAAIAEFQLIERLASIVGPTEAPTGIGDDAAVIDQPGPDYLLATVDMLVEGVHFDRSGLSMEAVGRRAMAVNVSDIAAMGGRPAYALVSLALPSSEQQVMVEQLYTGLVAEAGRHRVAIVGGNVTRIDGPLAIDVTLLGSVSKEDVVRREGARVGDILAVTGTLGSAAALRLGREAGLKMPPEWYQEHLIPRARIDAGQALAARHLARAMLDLSDGLSGDLRHLGEASGVGARIRAPLLPIDPITAQIARSLAVDPLDLALSGGEDYELLVALLPGDVGRAQEAVAPVPLTVVGEVVSREAGYRLITLAGTEQALPAESWRHF